MPQHQKLIKGLKSPLSTQEQQRVISRLLPRGGAFGNITRDIKSQFREQQLENIALSPTGFSPEQMNILFELLGQQLGASKTQATNRLKQSTAGAPVSVRQSVLANLENQFLGAKQRGVTQIQSSGLDRQLRALMSLLQADIQREQLSAQSNSDLFRSITSLGLSFGQLAAGKPPTP